jgi:lactate dehydrogenase-like 2-hydroxyacid dehydrogenase
MPKAKYKTFFMSERAPVHQKTFLAAAPEELVFVDSPAEAIYLISERQGEIDAAFLEKAPNLKLILRLGSQSHDIDLDTAKARGIAVCTWPQASVARVAEHAIMQMLALTKHLNNAQAKALEASDYGRESKRTDENTFAYNWSKREGIGSIFGKTIGILGFGEIGFELAKRLQNWNVTLLYRKRQRLPKPVEAQYQLRYVIDLFSQSDILVNLLPYSPETNLFIDAAVLSQMKPSAFLVSVGSGSIIDESALAEAIKAEKIAGAALDTYEYEPLRPDNPLLELARIGYNLLLTPHVAAGTMNSLEERREHFTNILRHIKGEALLNQVV